MNAVFSFNKPKTILAVSCLVLCAACVGESSDPGATGRAPVVDLFSPWPGDESLRTAAEPSLVVGSDESLPLGRVSGAVFFGDGIAIADILAYEVLTHSPFTVFSNEDRAVRLLQTGSGRCQSVCAFQELCGPKVVGHLPCQHVANLPLKGTLVCLCLELQPIDDAVVQIAYGQVAHVSLQRVDAVTA